MNCHSKWHSDQQGFAFITALAVMAILAIVVAAFVRLMIGDVVLANYQRSTTEAFYLADAGVQEGLYRLTQGYVNPLLSGGTVSFPSSANPADSVEVKVLAQSSGLAIYEITASGTVRGITRRVRLIVAQRILPAFSDAILGKEIEVEGSAEVNKGTLYSQEEIELAKWDCSANQIAFAAEEVEYGKKSYSTHEEAKATCPNLFPGTRIALFKSDWENLAVPAEDCSLINAAWNDNLQCKRKDDDDDSGTDNPDVEEVYVSWEDWEKAHPNFFPYNFIDNGNGVYDRGDPFTDSNGNGTYDAGEPYTDLDGDGTYAPPELITGINEAKALLSVIPPWPDLDPLAYWSQADISLAGGDPDDAVSQSRQPGYGPVHESSRPLIVLDDPSQPLNVGTGHGVLLVKGDLKLAGNLIWYGTIYVTGELEGEGNVTVYGGLIVQELDLKGNITVYPGFIVPEYFNELSEIKSKAWHENR